jgi:hypothetical protein
LILAQVKPRTLEEIRDPAIGTDRMLLHNFNYSLRLFGDDIDRDVLRTAEINGALDVPWLVRPFPEEFFASAFQGGGSVEEPGRTDLPGET